MTEDLNHALSCLTTDPHLTQDENSEVHYLASDLPKSLPMLQEIYDAFTSSETFHSHNQVAKIGDNCIVERGKCDIFEGWTMLYLNKMTSIPVPTVYAILTDKTAEPRRTIIVMEYIQGQNLLKTWKDLDVS